MRANAGVAPPKPPKLLGLLPLAAVVAVRGAVDAEANDVEKPCGKMGQLNTKGGNRSQCVCDVYWSRPCDEEGTCDQLEVGADAAAKCSINCEGSSTKSVSTLVPASLLYVQLESIP